MDNIVRIYTDGACSGNPGPGGIGIILVYKGIEKEISERYAYTTNNRMELTAVTTALQSLKKKSLQIEIYSDSRYVVDAIEKGWVFTWEKNGFLNRKNSDLWILLLQLYKEHDIKFIWVKGHASNTFNNRCDCLAVNAIKN